MSIPDFNHPNKLDKHTLVTVLGMAAFSVYWVIFLWGFWQHGIFALGVNAMVWFAGTAALFLRDLRHRGISLRRNLYWLVPTALLILSFGLYENPFLKFTAFFILPFTFAAFTGVAHLTAESHADWDSFFLVRLGLRFFSFFKTLRESLNLYGRLPIASRKSDGTARRVVIGLLIFFAVAATVVVPLLSSADAAFATQMEWLLKWVREFVSATAFLKLSFAILFAVFVLAAFLAWTRPMSHAARAGAVAEVDSIVVGIFLAGTLGLYLLFLGIQLQHLWVGRLPFNFKEAEQLVKSGFWQLLGLTLLNIVLYFNTYRRTKPAVQKLLAAFMFASLLLLASAAQRVGLYVVYYGFSYEKFYAAFTVLYCGALLIWLLTRLFVQKRADILRFAVILCFVMYAAVSIFPTEQFIVRANVALVKLPDSQIRLYEMTMLSGDVLALIKRYHSTGALAERTDRLEREAGTASGDLAKEIDEGWGSWIAQQEKAQQEKAWYEKSLSALMQ